MQDDWLIATFLVRFRLQHPSLQSLTIQASCEFPIYVYIDFGFKRSVLGYPQHNGRSSSSSTELVDPHSNSFIKHIQMEFFALCRFLALRWSLMVLVIKLETHLPVCILFLVSPWKSTTLAIHFFAWSTAHSIRWRLRGKFFNATFSIAGGSADGAKERTVLDAALGAKESAVLGVEDSQRKLDGNRLSKTEGL